MRYLTLQNCAYQNLTGHYLCHLQVTKLFNLTVKKLTAHLQSVTGYLCLTVPYKV